MQDLTVFEAMARLPQTEEEIKEMLSSIGIKGIPQSSDSCPIANYLKKVVHEDDFHCFIVSKHVLLVVYPGDGRCGGFRMPLPFAVANFVASFDAGRYPELVV